MALLKLTLLMVCSHTRVGKTELIAVPDSEKFGAMTQYQYVASRWMDMLLQYDWGLEQV